MREFAKTVIQKILLKSEKANDPSNLAGKLFGCELKFASTSNASVAPANYNGNITEAIWKNAEDGGNVSELVMTVFKKLKSLIFKTN